MSRARSSPAVRDRPRPPDGWVLRRSGIPPHRPDLRPERRWSVGRRNREPEPLIPPDGVARHCLQETADPTSVGPVEHGPDERGAESPRLHTRIHADRPEGRNAAGGADGAVDWQPDRAAPLELPATHGCSHPPASPGRIPNPITSTTAPRRRGNRNRLSERRLRARCARTSAARDWNRSRSCRRRAPAMGLRACRAAPARSRT
jgi:hypothetical protein